jgi:hypothetical protein
MAAGCCCSQLRRRAWLIHYRAGAFATFDRPMARRAKTLALSPSVELPA